MAPVVPEFFNFTLDVIDRWARETPEARALWIIDESGQTLSEKSFRVVSEEARRAALAFQNFGIRKGDRVLVMMPRISAWWISMLGLIRIGAVPIPGTPLLTPKDIAYRLEVSEAVAVLTDAESAARLDDCKARRRIVAAGTRNGWLSLDDAMRDAGGLLPGSPTRSSDPGIIYFTSGTTGFPKMVLHNQVSYGLGHTVTGKVWLDLKPGDVLWNMSDTGWAKAAWSSFFAPWLLGAAVFAVDARNKFDPVSALNVLSRFPVTVWCAPPTALRLMVKEDLSQWKFPALRHCVSAGEPLNPEVIHAWEKATGIQIFEGFGQTESVVLVGNFRCSGDAIRPGSMGKPTPGFELAIVGPDLNPLPDGTEGELAVRVKPEWPLGLFQEYWKNPEENASRFRGDWYFTGDVARRDRDGYFWFVGRADDVIKSSGYRIGPFEVESALVEHPAVLESAVVGKKDEARGQIVKAFVVLRKSFEPSEALAADLQEHCKRTTAPYKYPREIEFVTELPKTISGKIRRVQLRNKA